MAYRLVYSEFWTDAKIQEELTPEDRYFYLYLLTNPNTTMCGIYQITKKKMAFELGYSIESINSLVERFENHHKFIVYNQETRELALLNWGKYNLNKGGKPVKDCLTKELLQIKDKHLIELLIPKIKSDDLKKLYLDFLSTGEGYFSPSKTSTPKCLDKISTREYVIFRDNQTCFYTGKKLRMEDIEVDHIIPNVSDGTGDPTNLVVTSKNLNRLKGMNNLKDFLEDAEIDFTLIDAKIKQLELFERLRLQNNISYRDIIENKIHDLNSLQTLITNRKNTKYDSYKKEIRYGDNTDTDTDTDTNTDTNTNTSSSTEEEEIKEVMKLCQLLSYKLKKVDAKVFIETFGLALVKRALGIASTSTAFINGEVKGYASYLGAVLKDLTKETKVIINNDNSKTRTPNFTQREHDFEKLEEELLDHSQLSF
ncbi:HNH endonuclease [Clostridium perfringens]|uniref:HNH endonuclease n=1 Tax=Clostridium perfringens TaxID=1502 RepID=UPI000F534F00|nr:HNH endonuclease signature motif containing protein [Clostridium perfringens]